MTLAYLPVLEAKRILALHGLFTDATMPSDEKIEYLLDQIETQIDGWIGHRVAPMEYSEVLHSSESSLVLSTHYPLISINRIENAPNQFSTSLPLPEKLLTGDCRLIDLQTPYTSLKVFYSAGLDPVPKIFADTTSRVLAKVFDSDITGNLSILDQPVKDIETISLPGGLKKSYKLGSSVKSGERETELDRLLFPLSQYKNRLITTGSGLIL